MIFSKLKGKQILWLLAIGMIIIMLMFIACNGNTKEGDAVSIENHILNLGYENCLVCHTGGKVPIADHCKKALGDMVTLDNCLMCHLEMRGIVIARHEAYFGCAACHIS